MSIQRLGKKNLKQARLFTDLDIIRAWTFGTNTWGFVTRDHRHGVMFRNRGVWERWEFDDDPTHMDTCQNIDPTTPSGHKD